MTSISSVSLEAYFIIMACETGRTVPARQWSQLSSVRFLVEQSCHKVSFSRP